MKSTAICIVFVLMWLTTIAQDSTSSVFYYQKQKRKSAFFSGLNPGINLFVQTSRGLAIDFNPYIFKTISKKWAFGIGWNERVSLRRGRGGGSYYIAQLYGPRLSIKYSLSHGFSFHLLPDFAHVRWPRNLYPPDHARYSWEWSVLAGIRKDFRVGKRNIGYVEILYDAVSSTDLPLYGDKVNLRLGFELGRSKH